MAYRFLPELTADELAQQQLDGLQWTVSHSWRNSPFYRKHLGDHGVEPDDIKTLDDIVKLPLTTVSHLREGYPLPLLSVPEKDIVRVHASSGTTGKRKILAYTQNDVDTFAEMMARCYELAGLTQEDRIQLCVGYGLWTAGAGFQLGCERFGAMAVPIGPGMLDIQMQLLEDLGVTCICSTASMALLMAEEVSKRGLKDKIRLRRAIFGSETHSPKMRQRFTDLLGLEDSFDISGMTELYGPGAGLECSAHQGIHYWADKYILEILDPETLQPVAPGEIGEMVVTTLCKEAAPLIRYRTRDLCRIIPGECSCGLSLPRHDKILGRSDDMIIVRGVNIYPGQIAKALEGYPEAGSEYQIRLSRKDGRDMMELNIERAARASSDNDDNLAKTIAADLHKKLLVRTAVNILDTGELPRTFAKSKRVLDERNEE